MARSTYIYIILRPSIPEPVVAAFTVKHECQSYIEDSEDPHKGDWEVRRYRDGEPWTESEPGVLVTFD